MHRHVEQVHATFVLGIEPRDVCPRTRGLDHHGNPVKIVVAWVKDKTSHKT
jgi:hypothetical protein